MQLTGTTNEGRALNLGQQYKGKVVLIQYWSTNCQPCIEDMAKIKDLVAKYGRDGFFVIGVNLDNQKKDMLAFLQKNKLSWPQLWEDGGLDSRFANEMGILTMPTMILIDKQGKVANRGIHISQVGEQVQGLLH